jgi:hypothetical protein
VAPRPNKQLHGAVDRVNFAVFAWRRSIDTSRVEGALKCRMTESSRPSGNNCGRRRRPIGEDINGDHIADRSTRWRKPAPRGPLHNPELT